MRSPHLPVPISFSLQPPQQPHSPPLSLEQQALPTLQAQNTTIADALRRHANPSTRSGLVPRSRQVPRRQLALTERREARPCRDEEGATVLRPSQCTHH